MFSSRSAEMVDAIGEKDVKNRVKDKIPIKYLLVFFITLLMCFFICLFVNLMLQQNECKVTHRVVAIIKLKEHISLFRTEKNH